MAVLYKEGLTYFWSKLKTMLNGKQNNITGGATTITTANLTANRALISNVSGKVAVSPITNTELNYLDGVTSNIQTQLNSLNNNKSPVGHNHNDLYYQKSETYTRTDVDWQVQQKMPYENYQLIAGFDTAVGIGTYTMMDTINKYRWLVFDLAYLESTGGVYRLCQFCFRDYAQKAQQYMSAGDPNRFCYIVFNFYGAYTLNVVESDNMRIHGIWGVI